jgi:hypothetical protein
MLSSSTPSPSTLSPPTANQPPANPNAPLPGYGNLTPCLLSPGTIRRTERLRPRRPVRCPRQPRQRTTSAAPSLKSYRPLVLNHPE